MLQLVRILGPEKALNIIEAKEITERSIKRAINEYKKRVGTECFICDSHYKGTHEY